jgi:tetratricopeptide (TPR) repeat protein
MSSRSKTLILIGLIACLPRVVYLFQYVATPYFGVVFLDEQYHYEWASAIAGGRIVGDEAFFRAPLYCYLLGAFFSAVGPDLFLPRAIQLLAGAGATALVFLLGERLFGRRAGLIAWAFAAFHGPSIFFETELLDIVLQLLFLPAILLTALWWSDRPSHARAAALGVVNGLCAIARPNILLFTPVLLGVLLWRARRDLTPRQLAATAAVCLVAMGACVMPATLHNAIAERRFVPIATYGAINFYLGNNPNADGHTPRTRRHYHAFGRYRDSVELFSKREAEAIAGRPLDGAEVTDHWVGQSMKFIAESPANFLSLLARKFAYFWNDLEIKNNKNLYFVGRQAPALSVMMMLGRWGILAPLGLVGLALALIGRRSLGVTLAALMLGVFMVSVILFFVSARHRLPAVPLLALFAGYTVDRAIDFARERRWRAFGGVLVGCLLLGALTMPHWFDIAGQWRARDWWTLGNCHKDKGELPAAAKAYRQALEVDANDADVWNNLGEVLYLSNDKAGAERAYLRAHEAAPDYPRALNNLGVCLEERGALDEAAECFIQVVAMAPDYALAHQNLGDVRLKQQRWEDALASFDKALTQYPISPLAHLGRARALRQLARPEEANTAARRALELGGQPLRDRMTAGNIPSFE